MDSVFLFDPTSFVDDDIPSSFLSFSSLADFISSPLESLSTPVCDDSISAYSKSQPASDTSSPTPSYPLQIIESAFEPHTPASFDFGIFHTPSQAGPSKRGKKEASSSVQSASQRTERWQTPVTPTLTTKSSADSCQSFATGNEYRLPPSVSSSPYSWDEASTSLGSTSYSTTPVPQAPLRIASNPTLGASPRRPQAIKNIKSMPALHEEDQTVPTPSQWFDGTDFGTAGPSQQAGQATEMDDALIEDFDWVFGDFSLGDTVPIDSTIFSAFQSDEPSRQVDSHPFDAINPFPEFNVSYQQLQQPASDLSWLPDPSTQDVTGLPSYDFISQMPSFTIDPMAVMAPNGVDEQRPSSAPGLKGNDGFAVLSVPAENSMSRSISSDCVPTRHAPLRDLLTYAPQQNPSSYSSVQPLFTTDPASAYNPMGPSHYPRSMPLTPNATRRQSRQQQQQLFVQIHPPNFSTYMPHTLPPTPQSATFPTFDHPQAPPVQAHPVQMTRAGTQPLPHTRRRSGVLNSEFMPVSTTPALPAHLARAQAIVQMQEAKAEAERQELRRQAMASRVNMAEASVMQPQVISGASQRPRQKITGWEAPTARTQMPMMTSAPLVTVHPPTTHYYVGPTTSVPSQPMMNHKVHPPPHPGHFNLGSVPPSRPTARMPSPPSKRKPSSNLSSPSKRSPAGKRKPSANGGMFSWGETQFINFTSEDAEKLLTGVAPSGSQGKRKREDGLGEGLLDVIDEVERIKRAKSFD